MPPEAWIPITLAAAFLQNIRSYLQKRLVDVSTVHGGAYVRFLYALPFAWIYVFVMADDPLVMSSNPTFWCYCAAGAISQIVATGFFVLLKRVTALFGHFVEYDRDLRIVQFDPLIHFTLFDGGQDQANNAQTALIAATQGILHILLELVFQGHEAVVWVQGLIKAGAAGVFA